MKRKSLFSVTAAAITILLALYLPKHVWTTVSMDGGGGGGFGAEGKALGFSTTTWKSLGGAIINESTVEYSSSEDARRDFDKELNGPGAIDRSEVREPPDSNARLVRVVGDVRTGAVRIVSLRDTRIRYIDAGSLEYARAFEKAWLKPW